MKVTKRVYQGVLLFFMVAVIGTVIFIYLNTKGYLLQWFGYQSSNQYLLFDYHWGSNRGSTWMISWQAFLQMPFYQKLFGVGPDSLSQYLYSVPNISDLLYSLWGNLRLTNAHNEYLNCLLNLGVVGLAAWLSVLFGGMAYFYEKAKENSYMIGFALCIMGYACHNIFCYQQVCATPFLFIVLGIGESLTKFENFNTIK
ncbi:MAG: O-antigen ligase family protein [Lachnospiraceae bacterium]|nr:O-antigen ligase family protein [Lachnospiraceae bacterium]